MFNDIAKRFSVILLTLVISAGYSYCQDHLDSLDIKVGGVELVVEIAADRMAREQGLMHREVLPEGMGMLFVFPDRREVRLWMKDTLIPLSAAFIDTDGRIMQIEHMEKTRSTKVYRSNEMVKFSLEVPLGWFERNGIEAGDYCEIPDIPSN
ncbi:MAG: DUF192 domain-containing protein [Candidatus Omnitrophica bacterium]|nr:DUF192 domain-containing protein [Candidatus Omnitrophota bacterium]